MKPPRLVVVTWNDAWEPGHNEKIEHRPFVQCSVGFEIKNDAVGLTIAGCIDEAGDSHREMFIPRGMIQRVRRVT